MMGNRISIFTLMFFYSLSVSAQITKILQDQSRFFEQATMLYEKEQYIPAISNFEEIEGGHFKRNQAYEAQLYSEMAKLSLRKYGASYTLAQTARNNPEYLASEETHFDLGLYHFERGRHKQALRYFNKTNDKSVPNERLDEYVFKKGYSYFKNDSFRLAKAEFAKLNQTEGPYYVQSNYYYGYQCYILKNYDCARKSWTKIAGKGPKTIDLYLAQMLYEEEKYEEALELVQNLNLSKRKNEISLLKGKIHYQLGNFDLAANSFADFKGDIESLDKNEQYQLAYSYFRAKKYDKAKDIFSKIAGFDGEISQNADYHLGVAFLKTDEKKKAYLAFGEAKRKDYDLKIKELSHYNHVKLATEIGEQRNALKSIEEFINEYPRSEYADGAKSLMAQMLLSTKNYKEAIRVLEGISQMNGPTKAAYQNITYHRAEEMYLNKEYQNAHTLFKKSLKYNSDKKLESQAYFWIGEIFFQLEDYEGSIENHNSFLALSSSSTKRYEHNAYYSIGYNYFRMKEYGKAQQYFSKYKEVENYGLKNKKQFNDNSLRLADCYFINGDYTKAINNYSDFVRKDYKRSDYALFQMGMLQGLSGKTDEKLRTLEKIQKDFKSSLYADDALYEIGKEQLESENYSNAERSFSKIISDYPKSKLTPVAHLKLGLIDYNQSKDNQALTHYKTVVEKYPKSSSAKEAIEQIEIIYVKSGKAKDFIDYLEEVPTADVSLSYQDSVIYESAMNQYRTGNYEKAVLNFREYLAKFKHRGYFSTEVNYYKAECDYYADRTDDAIIHYEYVVDQGNTDYLEKSSARLADIYYSRKEYAKSARNYANVELVATDRDRFIKSMMGQMRCYYLIEEFDQAKNKAKELLLVEDVDKNQLVEVNMTLGRIQFADSNLLTALYHFDNIVKESRGEYGADALYHRALIKYTQSNLEEAKNDVFDLNDNYASYEDWVVKGFILLSDIYVKEKDLFQARATLQSIIDNYDGDESLINICKEKLATIDSMESNSEKEEEGESFFDE